MRRNTHRTIVSVGLIVLPAAMYAVGCGLNEGNGFDNAEARIGVCNGANCIGVVDGGGDGGTINPGCVPSDIDGGLADTCGIFVSSSRGSDTNPGTMMDPVATITKAIELASAAGKPVYACAEQFDEGVIVTTSAYLYGGLNCANGWAYIGDTQKTTLTTPMAPPLPDSIPLTLASGITATIQDFHVRAKDATDPDATTGHGGSSIAVIADRATATFVGCIIEAGDGAAGEGGQAYTTLAAAGANGVGGNPACSGSPVPGPDGPTNTCGGVDTVSFGGPGGAGTINTGSPGGSGGTEGSPNFGMVGGNGDCAGTGSLGQTGLVGNPGPNGMEIGTIDKNGYTGVSGSDGTPGTAGQGGGGGGGSKGGTGGGKCPDSTMAGGASGGSGASGGCGGLGGRGGKPGGASIAVVSIAASLTFESSQVVTKNGGAGGLGGDGQNGGGGGASGGAGGSKGTYSGLSPGCDGGPGGAGGKGGPGGDGVGGHSIGIAYTGTAPAVDDMAFMLGMAATAGVVMNTQEFP